MHRDAFVLFLDASPQHPSQKMKGNGLAHPLADRLPSSLPNFTICFLAYFWDAFADNVVCLPIFGMLLLKIKFNNGFGLGSFWDAFA